MTEQIEKDPVLAAARARRRGKLRLLGVRTFSLLFVAQVCALFGDQFYLVALPFFVLGHATAASLGNVLLAFGIGRLASLPFGGRVADRFPRGQIILGSYLVKAVLMAGLAVGAPRQLWMLMAVTAALGVTEGIGLPSTMSLLPQIVDGDDLPEANSLMSTATMGVSLLGPAIAGGVVHAVGPGLAFGVDACVVAVAVLAIARIRGAAALAAANDPAPDGAAKATMLGLLRTNITLRFSVIVTGIIALTFAGTTEVALPVYTERTLGSGSSGYGLLLTAVGVGGIAGSLYASALFARKRPAIVALSIGVLQGVVMALVTSAGALWFSFAALLVIGTAQTALNVFFVTTLQRRVPKEAMGTAMSAVLIAAYGGFPIAVTLAGHLIDSLGATTIFVVGGLMMSVGFASGFVSKEYRNA